MNGEKRPESEIVIESRFAKWFENFWYHYKWQTIGIAAAVIVLLVCVLQTCSRKEEDLTLTYAGPCVLSVSELEQLSSVMDSIMPYDGDGNGENHTAWMVYEIYSKEQILAIESQKDASGDSKYVDRNYNTDQYQTYNSYLKTGETSVYFLDPWLFAELRDAERLVPLQEALGTMPESAFDEYGVRLGDTELYERYKVMQLLPADTVVCLSYPNWKGSRNSDEEVYKFDCEMFRAIVTYSREE